MLTRGANFVANGHAATNPRRFAEPGAPSAARLREAIAFLAAGLAGIPKCRDLTEAVTVAMVTLARAGESHPDILRRPDIQSAIALAGTVAAARPAPASAVAPAAPSVASAIAAPAPPSRVSADDIEAFTQLLARQVVEQIKDAPASSPPPLAPPQPISPIVCDAAYWVKRIGELEERRRIEKMRGPPSSTVSTKLTAARKRLRALLQNGSPMSKETRLAAERILGI